MAQFHLKNQYARLWHVYQIGLRRLGMDEIQTSFPPTLVVNDDIPKNKSYFKCGSCNPIYITFSNKDTGVCNTVNPFNIDVTIYTGSIIRFIQKEFKNKFTFEQLSIFISHILFHEFFHYYEHLSYYKHYIENECDLDTYLKFLTRMRPVEKSGFKYNSSKLTKMGEESERLTEERCLILLYEIFSDYFKGEDYLKENKFDIDEARSVKLIIDYFISVYKERFHEDCKLPNDYKVYELPYEIVKRIEAQNIEPIEIEFVY